MSIELIGGLIGAAIGLANFFVLENVAKKLDLKSDSPSTRRGAKVMRIAAWADLIIFPLVGYYIGSLLGT